MEKMKRKTNIKQELYCSSLNAFLCCYTLSIAVGHMTAFMHLQPAFLYGGDQSREMPYFPLQFKPDPKCDLTLCVPHLLPSKTTVKGHCSPLSCIQISSRTGSRISECFIPVVKRFFWSIPWVPGPSTIDLCDQLTKFWLSFVAYCSEAPFAGCKAQK